MQLQPCYTRCMNTLREQRLMHFCQSDHILVSNDHVLFVHFSSACNTIQTHSLIEKLQGVGCDFEYMDNEFLDG